MSNSWVRGALLTIAASGLSACLGGVDIPIPDMPALVTMGAPTDKSAASATANHAANKVASSGFRADQLLKPDCYTVEPYQPIRIARPQAGAPAASGSFLGAWGGGAWDGRVCHDLWIMEIGADGHVLMFDAHGPGYRQDATGFLRRGEMTADGRIRVRKGGAMVTYWIQDGMLYGERLSGQTLHRVVMRKKS